MGVWVFAVNKWDQAFKRGLKDDFPYIFRSQIFKIQCWWIVYIYMKNDRYFNHMRIWWIDSLFAKNGARMQKFYSSFTIWVFFYRFWQLTRQNRMGGDHLCPSITFTQDIYLKFGIWDDCRLQLIAVHVNTRLLLECWFRFTYWFYVTFY